VFSTSRLSIRLTAFNTRRGLLLAIVLLLGTFAFSSNVSAQTYKISGHVTDGFSNSIVGAKVELSGAQTSNTTTDSGGNYSFSNLAAGGSYNLHATTPGNTLTFTRTISNLSSDLIADLQILFFVNFQILVRDVSGVGIAAVGLRVNNEPYIFAQTNSFGLVNIGIGVPITGNGPPVTFTPDKAGYVFAPPTATLSTQNGAQSVNFIGTVSNAPPIQLLPDQSGPDPNQTAALDAVLFTRDPFPAFRSGNPMVPDANSRITIMATNLRLGQGEPSSAVIVNLANGNILADVFAEDVRAVPGADLTQITFSLPNQTPAGTFTVRIKAHGQTSNAGTIRITN